MKLTTALPKYLMHYTCVDSLEKIISTKKLKFSRLDMVDDISEAANVTPDYMAKYCYVSSWCNNENENIALWNMYTKKMSGVCLKMPFMPFEFIHNNRVYSYEEINELPYEHKKIEILGYKELENNKNIMCESIDIMTELSWNLLFCDVNYRQDYFESQIDPAPEYADGSIANLPFVIGRDKHADWCFQNEYRYKLHAYNSFDINNMLITRYNRDKYNKVYKTYAPKQKALFIDLHQRSLDKLEIILGPKISNTDIKKVDLLISSNKVIKLSRSLWTGRIR